MKPNISISNVAPNLIVLDDGQACGKFIQPPGSAINPEELVAQLIMRNNAYEPMLEAIEAIHDQIKPEELAAIDALAAQDPSDDESLVQISISPATWHWIKQVRAALAVKAPLQH